MKQKANKSASTLEGKGGKKKPSNKQTTVLVCFFFIYMYKTSLSI